VVLVAKLVCGVNDLSSPAPAKVNLGDRQSYNSNWGVGNVVFVVILRCEYVDEELVNMQ
jgi:hypothetical protein